MAIQGINNIQANSGPSGIPDDTGVQAKRLFQDQFSKHQLLAQVVAPPVSAPVTPGGVTPLQPVPVLPDTGSPLQPFGSKPTDYGLTPYQGPVIRIPTLPEQGQGNVQGAATPQLKGLLKQLPNSLQSAKTDIAAWNTMLGEIASTLRLEHLSPVKQLQLNQQADRQGGLNARYAIGLQTRIDGPVLALTGELQELVAFFSVKTNADRLAGMHTNTDGLSLAGLKQRYERAVAEQMKITALNYTRQILKTLQATATANSKSFAELYPGLSLSTVVDRSTALKDGFTVNRQSNQNGAGLDQPYVFGFQYPVIFSNGNTQNVPVNLIGKLQELGPFIAQGGYSWLLANGLKADQRSGLTPEGLIKKYQAANTFDPNQRDAYQVGGTVGQELSTAVTLPSAEDNKESTVQTTLPYGSEKDRVVSVKPDNSNDKQNTSVIGLQPKQAVQPVSPLENNDNTGPIKASDNAGVPQSDQRNPVQEAGKTEDVESSASSVEQAQVDRIKQLIMGSVLDHVVFVHVGNSKPALSSGMLDILLYASDLENKLIFTGTSANAKVRRLSGEEKRGIMQEALELISDRSGASINLDPEWQQGIVPTHFNITERALSELEDRIDSLSSPLATTEIFNAERELLYETFKGQNNVINIFNIVQLKLMFDFYNPFALQDPDSEFQQQRQALNDFIENSPYRDSYHSMYQTFKSIVVKANDLLLNSPKIGFHEKTDNLRNFYNAHIGLLILGDEETNNAGIWADNTVPASKAISLADYPDYFQLDEVQERALQQIRANFSDGNADQDIRDLLLEDPKLIAAVQAGRETEHNPLRLLNGFAEHIVNHGLLSQYESKNSISSEYRTMGSTYSQSETLQRILTDQKVLLDAVLNFLLAGLENQPVEHVALPKQIQNISRYFQQLAARFGDSDQQAEVVELSYPEKKLANLYVYKILAEKYQQLVTEIVGSIKENPNDKILKHAKMLEKYFERLKEAVDSRFKDEYKVTDNNDIYLQIKSLLDPVIEQLIKNKSIPE